MARAPEARWTDGAGGSLGPRAPRKTHRVRCKGPPTVARAPGAGQTEGAGGSLEPRAPGVYRVGVQGVTNNGQGTRRSDGWSRGFIRTLGSKAELGWGCRGSPTMAKAPGVFRRMEQGVHSDLRLQGVRRSGVQGVTNNGQGTGGSQL